MCEMMRDQMQSICSLFATQQCKAQQFRIELQSAACKRISFQLICDKCPNRQLKMGTAHKRKNHKLSVLDNMVNCTSFIALLMRFAFVWLDRIVYNAFKVLVVCCLMRSPSLLLYPMHHNIFVAIFISNYIHTSTSTVNKQHLRSHSQSFKSRKLYRILCH